jgi:hypothetical protein
MLEHGDGHLDQIPSTRAAEPGRRHAVSATKHAANSLAITYGDRGIRISVCPQYMATTLTGRQATPSGSVEACSRSSRPQAIADGIEPTAA